MEYYCAIVTDWMVGWFSLIETWEIRVEGNQELNTKLVELRTLFTEASKMDKCEKKYDCPELPKILGYWLELI